MFSHSRIWLLLLAAVAALEPGLSACVTTERKDAPMRTLEEVTEVMDRHTNEIISHEGVVGIAIGALEDSSLCIQVLVRERTEELERLIPDSIEGVPVVLEETGEIVPMNGGDDR